MEYHQSSQICIDFRASMLIDSGLCAQKKIVRVCVQEFRGGLSTPGVL